MPRKIIILAVALAIVGGALITACGASASSDSADDPPPSPAAAAASATTFTRMPDAGSLDGDGTAANPLSIPVSQSDREAWQSSPYARMMSHTSAPDGGATAPAQTGGNAVPGMYRVQRFADIDGLYVCSSGIGASTHASIMLPARSGDGGGPIYARGKPGDLFIARYPGNSSRGHCEAGIISDEPFNPLGRLP